jgi:hypothetical protein
VAASLKNAGRIRCFFGTFSSSSTPVQKRADRFFRDFLLIGRFSDDMRGMVFGRKALS